MNPITIRRALISVSDKQGITEFARKLEQFGVDIISTGGTLKTLREAGVRARSISEVTGFPEILDGRVKTLHPKIHGGLLAISDEPAHMGQLREHDITEIDMVVVNLYPFEQTIAGGNVSLDDAVEQIDIGGPTMLRSAAKNFRFKTVIVNPARYASVLEEMTASGGAVGGDTRFTLAREVFLHTARYDSIISGYLAGIAGGGALPEAFTLALPKTAPMRYGENPHQQAALYGSFHTVFQTLHGKELSYNNIVDIQAAVELLEEFEEPTVVIIKHTNPCGVGSGATLEEAYAKALATDPKSAFGGIVAVNRPLTMEAATLLDKIFTEVVIAPAFGADVLELLKKKKDRRLIRQDASLKGRPDLQVKTVAGGVLVQTPDDVTLGFSLGLSAHAVGTTRALEVSDTAGAFAVMAMGLNGLLTALWMPIVGSSLATGERERAISPPGAFARGRGAGGGMAGAGGPRHRAPADRPRPRFGARLQHFLRRFLEERCPAESDHEGSELGQQRQ